MSRGAGYFIPVVGGALSLQDAYHSGKDAVGSFRRGDRRKGLWDTARTTGHGLLAAADFIPVVGGLARGGIRLATRAALTGTRLARAHKLAQGIKGGVKGRRLLGASTAYRKGLPQIEKALGSPAVLAKLTPQYRAAAAATKVQRKGMGPLAQFRPGGQGALARQYRATEKAYNRLGTISGSAGHFAAGAQKPLSVFNPRNLPGIADRAQGAVAGAAYKLTPKAGRRAIEHATRKWPFNTYLQAKVFGAGPAGFGEGISRAHRELQDEASDPDLMRRFNALSDQALQQYADKTLRTGIGNKDIDTYLRQSGRSKNIKYPVESYYR